MVQQALFPTESQGDKRISIGNGFAIEWLGKSHLTVYRYGIPYKICHIKEAIDRKTLVVELVLECGATQEPSGRGPWYLPAKH